MAIHGLTVIDGVKNKVTKVIGKISAGYAPNEKPNTGNSPMACGFFRALKQVVVTKNLSGSRTAQVQEWALNKEVQDKLILANNGNEKPRKVSFMCLYETPEQLFRSSLSKFNNDGLICTSQGEGMVPINLVLNGDKRDRKPRLFNGEAKCPYKDCPDFKKGDCSVYGVMNIFPDIDLTMQPYQFSTKSINTIVAIESSLDDMYNLSKCAHKILCDEAGRELEFKGLFGVKMELAHRKIKSGGRDVYVTYVNPSREFGEAVMNVIKRGIEKDQKLALESGVDMVEIEDNKAAMKMLEE